MRDPRTMNFDAIAAAAPLDAQAGAVRDGRGDHWVAIVPDDVEHWSAPPLPEHERPADVPDISGLVVGCLTVVRYHRTRPSGSQRSRWLVRCQCGDYELRRTRALAAPAFPGEMMCFACQAVETLRTAHRRDTPADRAEDQALFERLAAKAVRP
jgi:hypothetical protein